MKTKVNEIKISYQATMGFFESDAIGSSRHAANFLYENWDRDTISIYETFKVLLLNNSNLVNATFTVSRGGMTGTLVDMRILFAVVLKSLSVGIILAHNHPSGTLKPSTEDQRITDKIKNAGKFFDIKLLDHLILVPNGNYFSFADEGLL